jgi:hypothetical protein
MSPGSGAGSGSDGPSLQGVANLVHGLAEAIDDGDGPRIEALFGDATFVLGDNPPRVGGAGFRAIVEQGMIFYDGSPCTQHVISNLAVTIDDVDGAPTAMASSRVTVLQAVPPDLPLQAVMSGRYADRFRWTDDGWAWVERRMVVTQRGDTSKHSVHRL